MFKLPDGSLRLIVQGLARVHIDAIVSTEPYLRGRVRQAEETVRRRGPARDRRDAAEHQVELPAGRVAVAAALRRSADAGAEHHRARAAGRLHRVEPEHDHDRGEAGDARDARRAGADGEPEPRADQGARGPRAGVEDPVAGPVGGRQEPARLLPARAAEGHPARARRGRRPGQGDRGAAREDRGRGHAGGRSRRRRSASWIAWRRCPSRPPSTRWRGPTSTGWSPCRGRSAPTRSSTSPARSRSSTRTTPTSRRSRTGSSSTSPCASSTRR